MVRVIIGDNERDLASVSENWVNQQLNRRKTAGEPICARVLIFKNNIDMALSTSGCERGKNYKHPNRYELELIEIWKKLGLDSETFYAANFMAFLNKLKS